MNDTLDGEFQKFSVAGGAYIREHFFGPDPRLRKLVEHLSDDDLAKLRRGGHDYRKVYAAYKAATEYDGRADGDPRQDGQGLDARAGSRGPQHHPPGEEAVRGGAEDLPRPPRAADPGLRRSRTPRTTTRGRTRRRSSTSASDVERSAVTIPKRIVRSKPLPAPSENVDKEFAGGSDTAVSTTMVFTRILRNLIRDKELGRADRADHPRRGADVRHGPALQGGRHLRRARPALRAGRLRSRAVIPRGGRRPGPRGGDHRGGLDGLASRRLPRRTRRTAIR